MRILFGIALISCMALPTIAQTTNQSDSAPETQSVCKDQKIPADRVVVGVFVSAACSPPETENAWDTAIPEEGTIACEWPGYTSAAVVLRFKPCESVVTNKCPARLDGLQNAVTLRSPPSCLEHGGVGLTIWCTGNKQELPSDEFVVGTIDSEKCKNENSGVFTRNAFIVQRRPNLLGFRYCENAIKKTLDGNEVIVRRFYSEFCPVPAHTPPVELNSIVIMKLSAQSLQSFSRSGPWPKRLTICQGFNHAATEYSELCGGQTNRPNSFEVAVGSDGLVFSDVPASCLVGLWREQYDHPLVWTFNVNGETLSIRRADGGVTGTFSKSGRDWTGELNLSDGSVWKSNVVLSPTADCNQVRTNQEWWYRR